MRARAELAGGAPPGAPRPRFGPSAIALRRLAVAACVAALAGVIAAPAAARPPGVRTAQKSWDQLDPQQRSRALQNYQRYQRLPESSRERVEKRYQQFKGLPPGEQEKVRKNYDVYRNMTPDQRQDFIERYQRWKGSKK